MKTILITGGSGLIGKALTVLLQSNGYEVIWLTRKVDRNHNIKQYVWNYKSRKIDLLAFENTDAVIHLAGANIGSKRWNSAYKKEIYESRIKSTQFLFDVISNHPNKIKKFTSASAIGFYGFKEKDRIFKETDSCGTDFLAKTCNDWETVSKKFDEIGIKTSIIRCGVVLSETNDTFKKITMPFKLGLGSAIGNGKQYFSWIHLNDLCNIYLKTITDDSFYGTYNAVAPELITNNQLTKILSNHFEKPVRLPNIPSWAIKILLGELGDSVLNGNKISSEKITSSGFQFKYNSISDLLIK